MCRERRMSAAHGCSASMTASSMRIANRTESFSRSSRSTRRLCGPAERMVVSYYRSVFPHCLVPRKKEQVATKPTNIQ
jgi:hypothetical protein